MAVIYIDADMPEACTKLMEERKEEWIEKWTERCAFYNICKHKDTIRNDYKPVDCPLKSVTGYELYIKACKFAVGEMSKRGSVAFFTVTGDEMEQVAWADVMEWLNDEQERAEGLKSM